MGFFLLKVGRPPPWKKFLDPRLICMPNLDPKNVYDAGGKKLGGTFYIENIPESCGTCSLC